MNRHRLISASSLSFVLLLSLVHEVAKDNYELEELFTTKCFLYNISVHVKLGRKAANTDSPPTNILDHKPGNPRYTYECLRCTECTRRGREREIEENGAQAHICGRHLVIKK